MPLSHIRWVREKWLIQKKSAVMDKNSFSQGLHFKKLMVKIELGLDWDFTISRIDFR